MKFRSLLYIFVKTVNVEWEVREFRDENLSFKVKVTLKNVIYIYNVIFIYII